MTYGQFVLDELIVSKLFKEPGAWENKYALQGGLKIFDFPIRQLDWQFEFNMARPFIYAHDNLFTSYTHYQQPLAHPLGANFKEVLTNFRYQPVPKLIISGSFLFANFGKENQSGIGIGQDPLIPYTERDIQITNNRIGQGISTDLFLTTMKTSYQWRHNLFFDLDLVVRSERSENTPSIKSTIIGGAVRWNIPSREYLF
jgi:hypothetical protein